MTRPELAVLLAYAKQSLTNAFLASSLPDSAYLETDLRGYFPPQVVERFGPLLNEHPLRRELIAMLVANDVVNSQGITFVSRVVTETGRKRRTSRVRTGSRATSPVPSNGGRRSRRVGPSSLRCWTI